MKKKKVRKMHIKQKNIDAKIFLEFIFFNTIAIIKKLKFKVKKLNIIFFELTMTEYTSKLSNKVKKIKK